MSTYVPALKGHMGDWTYYLTVMKLGQVARECQVAEQIHKHQDLDELIQRDMTDRVKKEMVPYLLKQPQRFYGALIVAVYGGHPEFSLVNVQEHELLNDTQEHCNGFGLLRFDGSQVYYALDGQHRLRSIQLAIEEKPELREEEISVIILKHENTKEGMERTRRLFTILNRKAQPTSKAQDIVMDEDDAVAIVTRRLIKEQQYIKTLVNVKAKRSKTLSPTKPNDSYITTLAAFYEANEALLSTHGTGISITEQFKSYRPTYEELDEFYNYLDRLWTLLLEACPGFKDVLIGRKHAGDLRKRIYRDGREMADEKSKPVPGGNVFARPIGHFIVADVLKRAVGHGKSIEETIKAIMDAGISMDIDDPPWQRVIWNPDTHTIVGGRTEKTLVIDLICHALGLPTTIKKRELRQKLRDVTGNKKAELLAAVSWSGRSTSDASDVDTEADEFSSVASHAYSAA